jgi:eukaryotic-like serine/threonine-protein kinase
MDAGDPTPPLGRYRLMALLGQGGMADVFLACTQGPGGFQKLLVVKLARFTGDPTFATMLLEEARIAAQLEHPNIVQTYEIADDGSRRYIVMEYLDGGNLAQLRRRSRATCGISLRMSLTILGHVIDGLEYAHEGHALDGRDRTVIHRDLSPSNIMVTAQGVVKILDFGIAQATDSRCIAHAGTCSGKLGYMSPEQLRGEPADVRDDLFAFGAILAEAALQSRLWGSLSDREIANRLGNHQIPTLHRGRPIDPALRAICARALAPERAQRYARARDLKADLAKYLARLGGPVSQHQLAEFVRTTVADDRARLKAIVEAELQQLGAQSWDGIPTLPALPCLAQTPTRPTPTPPTPPRPPTPAQPPPAEPAALALPAPLPPRRTRLLAFGGTILTSLIGFAMVRPWPTPPPASPPAPPQPGAADATASPRDTASPALATTTATDPVAMHHFDLDLGLELAHHPGLLPPVQTTRGTGGRPIYKRTATATGARPPPGPEPITKWQLDTGIDLASSDKRTLDPNVLDDSTTPRPTLEQTP